MIDIQRTWLSEGTWGHVELRISCSIIVIRVFWAHCHFQGLDLWLHVQEEGLILTFDCFWETQKKTLDVKLCPNDLCIRINSRGWWHSCFYQESTLKASPLCTCVSVCPRLRWSLHLPSRSFWGSHFFVRLDILTHLLISGRSSGWSRLKLGWKWWWTPGFSLLSRWDFLKPYQYSLRTKLGKLVLLNPPKCNKSFSIMFSLMIISSPWSFHTMPWMSLLLTKCHNFCVKMFAITTDSISCIWFSVERRKKILIMCLLNLSLLGFVFIIQISFRLNIWLLVFSLMFIKVMISFLIKIVQFKTHILTN